MTSDLAFATGELADVEEIRALLPQVKIHPVLLKQIPEGDMQAGARACARQVFADTGRPSLALLTDFYFADSGGDINLAGLNELRLFGPVEFCRQNHAAKGVVRIVFAFTWDGVEFVCDERDVPGCVSANPAGKGTGLDQIWIPNGYQRTIAELVEYQPQLNRRERAYRVVGNLLGTAAAQEIFEAHVTVELPPGGDAQRFRDTCADIGVKAIHIELPTGEVPTHFITGSVHTGTLDKVEREVDLLSQRFEAAGFRATRRKIEAMIQNGAVPLTDADAGKRPDSNYFEFHTKVTLHPGQDLADLEAICREFGAHLARSASNKLAHDAVQRFVTVRFSKEGRPRAEAIFARLIERLKSAGYHPSHLLKEYVVLDSNLRLDAGWADSAVPAACFTACDQLTSGECAFLDVADSTGSLVKIASR